MKIFNIFTTLAHSLKRVTWTGILSLVLLTGIVYSNTLGVSAFIRDDCYIIEANPFLGRWSALPRLLTTGYWEASMGSAAPVKEYRPALMLTYFLNCRIFGLSPRAFHLGNLLLQILNTILLFILLRRSYGVEPAFTAAALFAILPVHSEAVAYISGRSELLVLFFMLLSWKALDPQKPRLAWGLASFAFALLSKEQAILFPIFLAAADACLYRVPFHLPPRRRVYFGLAGVAGLYLLLRQAVLGHGLQAGRDYFSGAGYLTRLLTMSRFYFEHYLVPMVTGLRIQFDYARPLIPDSTPADAAAWLCLACWTALLAYSLCRAWKTRSRTAFWFLTAVLFLLPTGNLILKLDTLGADRFLYTSSVSFCVLAALAVSRLRPLFRRTAVCAVLAWYSFISVKLNPVWAFQESFCKAALAGNPYSAKSIAQLGYELWHKGELEPAIRQYDRALRLAPDLTTAYYNLGSIYMEKGDLERAKLNFQKALQYDPTDPDTWTCLGVVAERLARPDVAGRCYTRAIELQDFNATARYNLAHLLLMGGHPALARPHFEQFLRVAPDDPKAPAVRKLLAGLKV